MTKRNEFWDNNCFHQSPKENSETCFQVNRANHWTLNESLVVLSETRDMQFFWTQSRSMIIAVIQQNSTCGETVHSKKPSQDYPRALLDISSFISSTTEHRKGNSVNYLEKKPAPIPRLVEFVAKPQLTKKPRPPSTNWVCSRNHCTFYCIEQRSDLGSINEMFGNWLGMIR